MRTFPLLILIATACWAPLSRAEDAFGIWKMNPTRSTFTGDTLTQPQALTVRIEPHAKGEVFTVDRIAADGRATTSSTILYFDGKPRDFQGPQCSGTQSSRRADSRTVEIVRECAGGGWIRFVRRLAAPPNEMVLELTEKRPDGRRFERHLVLEKQ
jgi:hypothetical protein